MFVSQALADILISIHAPREGSDQRGRRERRSQTISIHAPREGSDRSSAVRGATPNEISIHAPREGSDFRPAS